MEYYTTAKKDSYKDPMATWKKLIYNVGQTSLDSGLPFPANTFYGINSKYGKALSGSFEQRCLPRPAQLGCAMPVIGIFPPPDNVQRMPRGGGCAFQTSLGKGSFLSFVDQYVTESHTQM